MTIHNIATFDHGTFVEPRFLQDFSQQLVVKSTFLDLTDGLTALDGQGRLAMNPPLERLFFHVFRL